MARFGCPVCQSESVTEVNRVITEYHIAEWAEDGTPIDYSGSNVIWDTAEAVEEEPYLCRDCGERFDLPQRLNDDEQLLENQLEDPGHDSPPAA